MDVLSSLLDAPVMTTLAQVLLHSLWQGAVLAAVLFLLLKTLPKRASELRYLASLLTLMMMPVASLITFAWLYKPAANAVAEGVASTAVTLQAVNAVEPASNTSLSWLTLAWLVGVMLLSARMLLEVVRVYRLPTQHTLKPDAALLQLFEQLKVTLHIPKAAALRLSAVAEVPMVVGIARPVVLLPFAMASGLSMPQLEMLLMHELAHIKRHDFLVNLIQTLVEILLFFNPAVSWVSRQVRIERECCCDDIAVSGCGNRHAYANALTDAEQLRHITIPQLAMAATGGDLKGRVMRMLTVQDCSRRSSRRWYGVSAAAVLSLLGAAFLFSLPHAVEERFKQLAGFQAKQDKEALAVVQHKAQTAQVSDEPNAEEQTVTLRDAVLVEADDNPAPELTAEATPEADNQPVAEEVAVRETDVTETVENQNLEVAQRPVQAVREKDTVVEKPSVETPAEVSSITEPAPVVLAATPKPPRVEQSEAVVNKGTVQQDVTIDVVRVEDAAPFTAVNTSARNLPMVNAPLEAQLVSAIKGTRSAKPIPPYTVKVSPSPVEISQPEYPRRAIKRNLSGEVPVSFVVNADGLVEQIRFTEDSSRFFRKAVRNALREWRFEPGTINGEVTAMTVRKVFSFTDPDRKSLKLTGSNLYKRI